METLLVFEKSARGAIFISKDTILFLRSDNCLLKLSMRSGIEVIVERFASFSSLQLFALGNQCYSVFGQSDPGTFQLRFFSFREGHLCTIPVPLHYVYQMSEISEAQLIVSGLSFKDPRSLFDQLPIALSVDRLSGECQVLDAECVVSLNKERVLWRTGNRFCMGTLNTRGDLCPGQHWQAPNEDTVFLVSHSNIKYWVSKGAIGKISDNGEVVVELNEQCDRFAYNNGRLYCAGGSRLGVLDLNTEAFAQEFVHFGGETLSIDCAPCVESHNALIVGSNGLIYIVNSQ